MLDLILIDSSLMLRRERRRADERIKLRTTIIVCPVDDEQEKSATQVTTQVTPQVSPPVSPPLTGPEAIAYALNNIDLDKEEESAHAEIKRGLKTKRGPAVKKLGFIQGFRRTGVHPENSCCITFQSYHPSFRPYSIAGDVFIPGDANELYRDLINMVGVHKELESKLGAVVLRPTNSDCMMRLEQSMDSEIPRHRRQRERGISGFLSKITGANPKFCYDDATEILTRKYGWCLFKVLPEDTEVASINPDTLAFEWQQPYAYIHDRYVGQMVHTKVGKRVSRMDLLVTPNHKMWGRIRNGSRRKLGKVDTLSEENIFLGWASHLAAQDIFNLNRQHFMVAAPKWVGVMEKPSCVYNWSSEMFAEFVGWYLSEGWTVKSGQGSGTISCVCQSEANPRIVKI